MPRRDRVNVRGPTVSPRLGKAVGCGRHRGARKGQLAGQHDRVVLIDVADQVGAGLIVEDSVGVVSI